jgi:hypothetical protein
MVLLDKQEVLQLSEQVQLDTQNYFGQQLVQIISLKNSLPIVLLELQILP